MRDQRCFDSLVTLDVFAAGDDVESYSSYSSSFCGSMGSLGCNGQESVSGVLSTALVSALALPDDSSETSRPPPQRCSSPNKRRSSRATSSKLDFSGFSASSRAIIEPIDFDWLLVRCDGDNDLVLEVLRSFCEQGQTHLSSMQKAMQEMDNNRLLFHSVMHLGPSQSQLADLPCLANPSLCA